MVLDRPSPHCGNRVTRKKGTEKEEILKYSGTQNILQFLLQKSGEKGNRSQSQRLEALFS